MLQPICPQPLSSWPACRSSSRAVLPQKNRRPSAGRTPPSPTAAAACPSSPTSPSCSHPPSVLRAAEGDHPRGLGADRAPRPCGPPSRPPAVHMPRLVPLALERLAFLPFLFVACRATEVKWLNPERGPIKGGTGVLVKGLDFTDPGLGALQCRFHQILVPAKVVSATLVKCSAPAMPEPVTVPLAVLDGTGQPLPGAELHFEYFHCDARECHIGDLVPLDKPLFGEEEQKDSPHELGQEDGGKDTPQAASPGEEEGRGPADGVADEQEDEEREHTKDPEPEGLARASANVKEETSEDIVESIVEIVAMEEEKERGGYFAAACLGFVVLYGMRLLSAGLGYGSATCIQVGARDSDSKTSLPKVSSTGRSIDAKHLDLGGRETTIVAESSPATCSSPALERASTNNRPNERGVRKQAALRHGFEDGVEKEEEQVSLGHLRWLMGTDGQALQKLQAVLSRLDADAVDLADLVGQLKDFDAKRLLHSRAVCTKALVHAGLRQDQAESVSGELYGGSLYSSSSQSSLSPLSQAASRSLPPSPASSPARHRRVASGTLAHHLERQAHSSPLSRERIGGQASGQSSPFASPPRVGFPSGAPPPAVTLHQQAGRSLPGSPAPRRVPSPVRALSQSRRNSGNFPKADADTLKSVTAVSTPTKSLTPINVSQPSTPPGSPSAGARSPSSHGGQESPDSPTELPPPLELGDKQGGSRVPDQGDWSVNPIAKPASMASASRTPKRMVTPASAAAAARQETPRTPSGVFTAMRQPSLPSVGSPGLGGLRTAALKGMGVAYTNELYSPRSAGSSSSASSTPRGPGTAAFKCINPPPPGVLPLPPAKPS